MLARTFNGNGWLWLDPLPPCSPISLSLRLLTSSPDALLLYSGPLDIHHSTSFSPFLSVHSLSSSSPQPQSVSVLETPFMPQRGTQQHPSSPQLILQLIEGRPHLEVKGPRGSVNLKLKASLHDGVWHTLYLHLAEEVGGGVCMASPALHTFEVKEKLSKVTLYLIIIV